VFLLGANLVGMLQTRPDTQPFSWPIQNIFIIVKPNCICELNLIVYVSFK